MNQAACESNQDSKCIELPRIVVTAVGSSLAGGLDTGAILDLRDMTVVDLGEKNRSHSGLNEPSHIRVQAGFMNKIFPIQRENSGVLRVVNSEGGRYKELRETAAKYSHNITKLEVGSEFYSFQLIDLVKTLGYQLDSPDQMDLEIGRSVYAIYDNSILVASFLHVGHSDIEDMHVAKCIWVNC